MLLTLPPEIVRHIITYINTDDVLSLQFTCKQVSGIARLVFWEIHALKLTKRNIKEVLQYSEKFAGFRELVRTLVVTDGYMPADAQDQRKPTISQDRQQLNKLLVLMSNLRSLQLKFRGQTFFGGQNGPLSLRRYSKHQGWDENEYQKAPTVRNADSLHLKSFLSTLCRSPVAGNLKSLILTAPSCQGLACASSLAKFSGLQALAISSHAFRDHGNMNHDHFRYLPKSLRFLCITSLCNVTEGYITERPLADWEVFCQYDMDEGSSPKQPKLEELISAMLSHAPILTSVSLQFLESDFDATWLDSDVPDLTSMSLQFLESNYDATQLNSEPYAAFHGFDHAFDREVTAPGSSPIDQNTGCFTPLDQLWHPYRDMIRYTYSGPDTPVAVYAWHSIKDYYDLGLSTSPTVPGFRGRPRVSSESFPFF